MSFTDAEVDRYARQLVLREIGGAGQQALKAAGVLIVGAGGLGAPAALYLTAAGVGRIGIVDHDDVALSNLHRQVIYRTADVGRQKVIATAERLLQLNDGVKVEPLRLAVSADNAAELVRAYDLVLDGTDDFATRLAVSDACVTEGKALVSGALGRWSGQVGVFPGRPCYRCFVGEVPPDAETCAAVGVVGALAGVIGSMMALEAVKLIAGAGEPLSGRLLIYD
ncbi:MAG TPA: HesA/MoeB/ThiF family protein, partial [Caulobacteraceae bacterium]|nr:HesA/MoeB/ThiF family protein [Caulobacteraceae bacterium]